MSCSAICTMVRKEDWLMTEAEWLACAEPRRMLDHVRQSASIRKLRLFTCAAEYSHRLGAPGLVDRYVEGLISGETFLASLPPSRPDGPPWSWERVIARLPQPDGGAYAAL